MRIENGLKEAYPMMIAVVALFAVGLRESNEKQAKEEKDEGRTHGLLEVSTGQCSISVSAAFKGHPYLSRST